MTPILKCIVKIKKFKVLKAKYPSINTQRKNRIYIRQKIEPSVIIKMIIIGIEELEITIMETLQYMCIIQHIDMP